MNGMNLFYSDKFNEPIRVTNEDIMQKIEEDLEQNASDDYDDRHRYDDHSNGQYHSTSTLQIPGIDGLDVEVEVDYTIYKGSGANDDPNSLNFSSIISTEDVHIKDIEVPTPDERAVIGLVHQAVMKIAPKTPPDILIPAELNMELLNDALEGLLNEPISELSDELYQKQFRY